MMGILLAGCTTDLNGFLSSKIKERIHAMVSLQGSSRNLLREMNHLRSYRTDKEAEIKSQEMQNYKMRRTEMVVTWLKSVEELAAKVDKFERDMNGSLRQASPGGASTSSVQAADWGNGCIFRRWMVRLGNLVKLSGEVADLIEEARCLKKEGEDMTSKNLVGEEVDATMETCDIQMFGGDANNALDTIHGHLADVNQGIIGIYGMGGVGKSTLLKRIKHEYTNSRKQEFSRVLWADVTPQVDMDEYSDDPRNKAVDIERLRHSIGKDLPKSPSGTWTAETLKEALLASGRFLLLLENVWDKLNLEMIGIPTPDAYNRCKIIFTTRSDVVRNDMDAIGVKLNRLTDEEAFEFFKRHLNNDQLLATCQNPAKIIVGECHGLPLALIVMARVMRSKNFPQDWFDAVEVLRDPRTKFGDGVLGEGPLFKVLGYSYWHLKHEWRPCLLYCSLFYSSSTGIDREEIIDYWIGEGFLNNDDDSSDTKSTRRKGGDIINQLVSACLLECSSTEEDKLKMHGLIHDLAIKIEKDLNDILLIYPDCMTKGEQRGEKWDVAKRISLSGSKITKLPVKNCPKLVTLLLKSCEPLSNIPDKFFDGMPQLRVLDLSSTNVQEIPRGIGNLKQLRYLNLSRTRIQSVPVELCTLTRLAHLDMSYTRELEQIPCEAISCFNELRTLNMFKSKYRWTDQDAGNQHNAARLRDLDALQNLKELSLSIYELPDLEDILQSDISQNIVGAHLEGLQGITPGTKFHALEDVRVFSISNIMDLETLEFTYRWFLNLKSVRLSSLSALSTLSITGRRNPMCCRLTRVEISRCNNLKDLSWLKLVVNLRILSLDRCKSLEVVIAAGDDERHQPLGVDNQKLKFYTLKSLAFAGLPKLKSFSVYGVQIFCLPSITVDDCPLLTGDFVYDDKEGKQIRIPYQNCRKNV